LAPVDNAAAFTGSVAVEETLSELNTSLLTPSVTLLLPEKVTVPVGWIIVSPALLVTVALSVTEPVAETVEGVALSVTTTADWLFELVLEMLVPQPANARHSGKHNHIAGKRRKRGQRAEVMGISVFNSCHQWNGDSFLRRF